MGRGRYKAFNPPNAPSTYTKPANAERYFEKPKIKAGVDIAKSRVSVTSDHSIGFGQHFIGVDTTNNAVTLTLPKSPEVAPGKIFIIKDEGGNASTNNITVDTADSILIDGAASAVLGSSYAAINIYYNGGGWFVY